MKIKLFLGLSFILAILSGVVVVRYYSYIFVHHVSGEVVGIDRVTQPTTVIGSQIPSYQIFSFAVAIKEENGQIMTSSSEDRQWAVVEKGQCVEAKFFPYPPWQLEKAGTYFSARLLKIYTCPAGDSK